MMQCCRHCPGCDTELLDVRGYYFATAGRTILFISFMFLNVAILEFGYRDAGCRTYDLDDEEFDDAEVSTFYEKGWSAEEDGGKPKTCRGKTHGVNPVSLIALMATIGGLSSAFIMPLAGSVVDATDHRLAFGRLFASLLVLANAAMIFINEHTWFSMAIVQASVASFSYMGFAVVVYAYLPELTSDLEELTRICSLGRFYETLAMLGIIVVGVALQLGLGLGVVDAARMAQLLAVVFGAPFLAVGLFLYRPRKRSRAPRAGYGLFLDGVMQLGVQWKSLRADYPDAANFLLGMCFFEAATGTVTTASTVLLVLNGMPLGDITTCLGVVMITMLLGPPLNVVLTSKLGLVRNFVAALLAFIAIFAVFALLIRNAAGCWVLAPFVGVFYGWYYPAQNALYASLVPAKREAEFAGLQNFCSMVLSWVPSLVIAAGSESGESQLRLSILILPIFWAAGATAVSFIDTERVTRVVARDHDGSDGAPPPALLPPSAAAGGEGGDVELTHELPSPAAAAAAAAQRQKEKKPPSSLTSDDGLLL